MLIIHKPAFKVPRIVILLIQLLQFLFCKFPFAKHLTVYVPELNPVAKPAYEACILNIDNLSSRCTTYRLSFFGIFPNCDLLCGCYNNNEVRKDS